MREAAQLLGLCLDSVRRQLRSGKLPGVRVGRDWRVPERVLLAQMGLISPMLGASGVEMEEGKNNQLSLSKSAIVSSTLAVNEPEAEFSDVKIAREQTKILVEQAASQAELSERATKRLLAELDNLLPA